MPISVTLKINVDLPDEHQRVMVENEVPLEQYSRIMWNEQQKDAFVQRMDSSLPPEDAGDLNIDDLSSILQSTITQSAKDAGFTTKTSSVKSEISGGSANASKQPWYDCECYEVKRNLHKVLKMKSKRKLLW